MEMFYPADSQRLPVETIQELNGQIFEGKDDGDMPFNDNANEFETRSTISKEEFFGWDDGDMPFNDNDNEFETRSTISKEEFFEWEFNNG